MHLPSTIYDKFIKNKDNTALINFYRPYVELAQKNPFIHLNIDFFRAPELKFQEFLFQKFEEWVASDNFLFDEEQYEEVMDIFYGKAILNTLTFSNFEVYGKKTFYIADNLVESLAFTEVKGTGHFLCLPFNSCMFVYTSPIMKEAARKIVANKDMEISDVQIVMRSEEGVDSNRSIFFDFQINHKEHEHESTRISRRLPVHENLPINDILSDNGESADLTFSPGDTAPFFAIVANTILYLNSQCADLIEYKSPAQSIQNNTKSKKSSKKIKKLNRKLEHYSSLNYIYVGGNFHKLLPSDSQKDDSIEARRVHYRFVVRGHWRNQPFGEGRQLRKNIWIKPFYKGPDMAELVNKPYVVK